MRQDIYGVISDDQKGVRGSTSSTMGRVNKVTVWINTDKHGQATLLFAYDKENDRVIVSGEIPARWENRIQVQKSPEQILTEKEAKMGGMTRLGSLI